MNPRHLPTSRGPEGQDLWLRLKALRTGSSRHNRRQRLLTWLNLRIKRVRYREQPVHKEVNPLFTSKLVNDKVLTDREPYVLNSDNRKEYRKKDQRQIKDALTSKRTVELKRDPITSAMKRTSTPVSYPHDKPQEGQESLCEVGQKGRYVDDIPQWDPHRKSQHDPAPKELVANKESLGLEEARYHLQSLKAMSAWMQRWAYRMLKVKPRQEEKMYKEDILFRLRLETLTLVGDDYEVHLFDLSGVPSKYTTHPLWIDQGKQKALIVQDRRTRRDQSRLERWWYQFVRQVQEGEVQHFWDSDNNKPRVSEDWINFTNWGFSPWIVPSLTVKKIMADPQRHQWFLKGKQNMGYAGDVNLDDQHRLDHLKQEEDQLRHYFETVWLDTVYGEQSSMPLFKQYERNPYRTVKEQAQGSKQAMEAARAYSEAAYWGYAASLMIEAVPGTSHLNYQHPKHFKQYKDRPDDVLKRCFFEDWRDCHEFTGEVRDQLVRVRDSLYTPIAPWHLVRRVYEYRDGQAWYGDIHPNILTCPETEAWYLLTPEQVHYQERRKGRFMGSRARIETTGVRIKSQERTRAEQELEYLLDHCHAEGDEIFRGANLEGQRVFLGVTRILKLSDGRTQIKEIYKKETLAKEMDRVTAYTRHTPDDIKLVQHYDHLDLMKYQMQSLEQYQQEANRLRPQTMVFDKQAEIELADFIEKEKVQQRNPSLDNSIVKKEMTRQSRDAQFKDKYQAQVDSWNSQVLGQGNEDLTTLPREYVEVVGSKLLTTGQLKFRHETSAPQDTQHRGSQRTNEYWAHLKLKGEWTGNTSLMQMTLPILDSVMTYTTDSKERVGNAFKQLGTGGALTLGTLLPKGQNVAQAEQFRDAPIDPTDIEFYEKRMNKTKGALVIPTAPIVRNILKAAPVDKLGIFDKKGLDDVTDAPSVMLSVNAVMAQGAEEHARQESQDRLQTSVELENEMFYLLYKNAMNGQMQAFKDFFIARHYRSARTYRDHPYRAVVREHQPAANGLKNHQVPQLCRHDRIDYTQRSIASNKRVQGLGEVKYKWPWDFRQTQSTWQISLFTTEQMRFDPTYFDQRRPENTTLSNREIFTASLERFHHKPEVPTNFDESKLVTHLGVAEGNDRLLQLINVVYGALYPSQMNLWIDLKTNSKANWIYMHMLDTRKGEGITDSIPVRSSWPVMNINGVRMMEERTSSLRDRRMKDDKLIARRSRQSLRPDLEGSDLLTIGDGEVDSNFQAPSVFTPVELETRDKMLLVEDLVSSRDGKELTGQVYEHFDKRGTYPDLPILNVNKEQASYWDDVYFRSVKGFSLDNYVGLHHEDDYEPRDITQVGFGKVQKRDEKTPFSKQAELRDRQSKIKEVHYLEPEVQEEQIPLEVELLLLKMERAQVWSAQDRYPELTGSPHKRTPFLRQLKGQTEYTYPMFQKRYPQNTWFFKLNQLRLMQDYWDRQQMWYLKQLQEADQDTVRQQRRRQEQFALYDRDGRQERPAVLEYRQRYRKILSRSCETSESLTIINNWMSYKDQENHYRRLQHFGMVRSRQSYLGYQERQLGDEQYGVDYFYPVTDLDQDEDHHGQTIFTLLRHRRSSVLQDGKYRTRGSGGVQAQSQEHEVREVPYDFVQYVGMEWGSNIWQQRSMPYDDYLRKKQIVKAEVLSKKDLHEISYWFSHKDSLNTRELVLQEPREKQEERVHTNQENLGEYYEGMLNWSVKDKQGEEDLDTSIRADPYSVSEHQTMQDLPFQPERLPVLLMKPISYKQRTGQGKFGERLIRLGERHVQDRLQDLDMTEQRMIDTNLSRTIRDGEHRRGYHTLRYPLVEDRMGGCARVSVGPVISSKQQERVQEGLSETLEYTREFSLVKPSKFWHYLEDKKGTFVDRAYLPDYYVDDRRLSMISYYHTVRRYSNMKAQANRVYSIRGLLSRDLRRTGGTQSGKRNRSEPHGGQRTRPEGMVPYHYEQNDLTHYKERGVSMTEFMKAYKRTFMVEEFDNRSLRIWDWKDQRLQARWKGLWAVQIKLFGGKRPQVMKSLPNLSYGLRVFDQGLPSQQSRYSVALKTYQHQVYQDQYWMTRAEGVWSQKLVGIPFVKMLIMPLMDLHNKRKAEVSLLRILFRHELIDEVEYRRGVALRGSLYRVFRSLRRSLNLQRTEHVQAERAARMLNAYISREQYQQEVQDWEDRRVHGLVKVLHGVRQEFLTLKLKKDLKRKQRLPAQTMQASRAHLSFYGISGVNTFNSRYGYFDGGLCKVSDRDFNNEENCLWDVKGMQMSRTNEHILDITKMTYLTDKRGEVIRNTRGDPATGIRQTRSEEIQTVDWLRYQTDDPGERFVDSERFGVFARGFRIYADPRSLGVPILTEDQLVKGSMMFLKEVMETRNIVPRMVISFKGEDIRKWKWDHGRYHHYGQFNHQVRLQEKEFWSQQVGRSHPLPNHDRRLDIYDPAGDTQSQEDHYEARALYEYTTKEELVGYSKKERLHKKKAKRNVMKKAPTRIDEVNALERALSGMLKVASDAKPSKQVRRKNLVLESTEKSVKKIDRAFFQVGTSDLAPYTDNPDVRASQDRTPVIHNPLSQVGYDVEQQLKGGSTKLSLIQMRQAKNITNQVELHEFYDHTSAYVKDLQTSVFDKRRASNNEMMKDLTRLMDKQSRVLQQAALGSFSANRRKRPHQRNAGDPNTLRQKRRDWFNRQEQNQDRRKQHRSQMNWLEHQANKTSIDEDPHRSGSGDKQGS